jgi:hypothetical protein
MSLQVRPTKTVEYEHKQSDFGDHLPKLPMRALCIGPSGGGKTVLLQWLILHAYKGCWARIYIFSPSAILDPVWRPVKKYCERELGMDPATEPCLFDEWDAKKFGELVMQQHRISEFQKTRLKSKTLHGVLFIVDDYGDRANVIHSATGGPDGGSWITSLFVRGRHSGCSIIVSSQYSKLLGAVLRTNCTAMFVFRLRSAKELLDNVLYELSAILPKKTLVQLYEHAVSQPYGFLYVNLMAKRRLDMFYRCFEARLVPEDEGEIDDGELPPFGEPPGGDDPQTPQPAAGARRPRNAGVL